MNRPVPLTDVAAELNRLCQAGRTGVLRIVTDKNHAASFGLVAGRIVTVRYRIKRNRDALPLLEQIQTGQFSFNDGEGADDESAALPSTEEILGQLGQHSMSVSMPVSAPVSAALKPTSVPDTQQAVPQEVQEPSSPATTLSPTEQAVVEAALAEHIGPMASIVCHNTFAKTSSLAEAIAMAASKIPDAERARQFEREVRGRFA